MTPLVWRKKKNTISPQLLCYVTVILTFHHCTGSQQSASRGHVLAFYGIAPCLSLQDQESKNLLTSSSFILQLCSTILWVSKKSYSQDVDRIIKNPCYFFCQKKHASFENRMLPSHATSVLQHYLNSVQQKEDERKCKINLKKTQKQANILRSIVFQLC